MIPDDVKIRCQMFGHDGLAWIGSVEVTLADAGSGRLLVQAVDHARYVGDRPTLVCAKLIGHEHEPANRVIGMARYAFDDLCKRVEKREKAA